MLGSTSCLSAINLCGSSAIGASGGNRRYLPGLFSIIYPHLGAIGVSSYSLFVGLSFYGLRVLGRSFVVSASLGQASVKFAFHFLFLSFSLKPCLIL